MEHATLRKTKPFGSDEAQTATASDVATWMIGELEKNGRMSQVCAVVEINRRFGDGFVNRKRNGRLAINKDVTAEFCQQTRECIVWVHRHRMWRWRRPSDKPGRQQ